jgi:hypothetical protein
MDVGPMWNLRCAFFGRIFPLLGTMNSLCGSLSCSRFSVRATAPGLPAAQAGSRLSFPQATNLASDPQIMISRRFLCCSNLPVLFLIVADFGTRVTWTGYYNGQGHTY